MVTDNDNDDNDGDGATGYDLDDDGKGATGEDVVDNAGEGATGDDIDDDVCDGSTDNNDVEDDGTLQWAPTSTKRIAMGRRTTTMTLIGIDSAFKGLPF